jgi:hypothetical protein
VIRVRGTAEPQGSGARTLLWRPPWLGVCKLGAKGVSGERLGCWRAWFDGASTAEFRIVAVLG